MSRYDGLRLWACCPECGGMVRQAAWGDVDLLEMIEWKRKAEATDLLVRATAPPDGKDCACWSSAGDALWAAQAKGDFAAAGVAEARLRTLVERAM